MTKTTKILAISAICLVVIAGCLKKFTTKDGQEQQAKQTVKIGVMMPASGDVANLGENFQKGFNLAKEQMALDNIEIVNEDSKCDPKEAVGVATKLITVDKVDVIIGEACSGATIASFPVAQQNKTVMLSPVSSSPKLSEVGKYFFRVIPSDVIQGSFGANLVYNRGLNKLAILYGNEEFGVGFEKVLRETFEGLGGEVVASESHERGATDLRTQLTKIKAQNPDAIYLAGNSVDSAVAGLKQIKELGIEATIVGSEVYKSEDIVGGAKDAANGLLISSITNGTPEFIIDYVNKYNAEPGIYTAHGYDAFKAVGLAIQGGAKTSEEINTALKSLEFDGATGKIKFDENGDVGGNYDVFEVQDGKFVQIDL